MTRKDFIDGLKDGIPIGAGYFAVAFSLGILAKRAGLNAIEGFFASLLNVASAGEYALFTSIASKHPILKFRLQPLLSMQDIS